MPMTVGVSLKMYFGHARAEAWFADVAARLREHPALRAGLVDVFVIPTYLQVLPAIRAFAGTGVRVGAQDVAEAETGAFTGEVSAAELAEVGVSVAEIGHAERRRLFGEDDVSSARKCAASLRHGISPVLCIGETQRVSPAEAAAVAAAQATAALADAPAGAVILAYEPVLAIGAPEPAPTEHIRVVTRTLRELLAAGSDRAGSAVIYGGSAGPGLLAELGGDADGLFLGRFAHDPAAFVAVIDEAFALATGGPS